MKFRSFGDSTSSSIQNKLQTLSLNRRKIQQKKIEIVEFTVNERSSNGTGCSMINGISNASEVTNNDKSMIQKQQKCVEKK